MSSKHPFFNIPPEIRLHIYSFMLLNPFILDIVISNMDETLHNTKGFLLTSHQSYHEATSYYYDQNTFLLSLTNPNQAPYRFPKGTQDVVKYLRRTQRLQLEIGPLLKTKPDFYELSFPAAEQWDWFLQTLLQAKLPWTGQLLKSLVMIHRRVYTLADFFGLPARVAGELRLLAAPNISRKGPRMREEEAKERRDALAEVVRPLVGSIEQISIETRDQSDDLDQWGVNRAWNAVMGVTLVD